jgi:hypothetical protein
VLRAVQRYVDEVDLLDVKPGDFRRSVDIQLYNEAMDYLGVF